MLAKFSRLSSASLVAAAATLPSASAWADGDVEGRVSDQTEAAYFDGAIVRIVETGEESVTRDGGRFRFSGLPAGDYLLEVSYVGAETVRRAFSVADDETTGLSIGIGEEVALIENIIVVGQLAGRLDAINQMRSADNLISVVSSDSIGQFPDENVSEALQRVSGVFIERDQGEGRFVGVRGIDPRLNVASINGLSVPAPENDRRNVALDVIPSDLVESLEVTKSFTPDQDGDAIGGTINIKSLSAFDRQGMSYKLQGQAYYNELEDEDGHKFAGTFTNAFNLLGGEVGVALSISSNERHFGTDNVESDGGWSDDDGIRFHEEMEARNYQILRERDGLALNLDFRATDTSSYFLRSLFSQYADQEFRNRIEYKLDKGDVEFDANTLTARDTELQRELKDRYEEQEISSIMLGGEHLIGDWTIEYSAGISDASESEPGRIDSEFEFDKAAFAGYRGTGSVPRLFHSEDAGVAENYELKEIVVEDNKTEDEGRAFRLDVTREANFGEYSGNVKFGAKLRKREKTNDANLRIFEDFDDAFADAPHLGQFTRSGGDYDLGAYGPFFDPGLQRRFVWDNIGGNAACDLASYDEDACPFIMDADGSRLGSARDYEMREDVGALYLMSRMNLGKLRVVYGVRYERTKFEADGFSVREVDVKGEEDVQIAPVSFASDYENLLPSVNLRYKATDSLILRAAYTQSVARPSFGDISPTAGAIEIEQDDDEIELKVEAGNPQLDPFESRNFDFSVEYYPERLGILNAGLFYKKIDNFIFQADVSGVVDPAVHAGPIAVTDIEIFEPRNGNAADLLGLEVGWTRHFSELPSPFDGLILMANATFTDSEADLGLGADADRDSDTALPLQADMVANFVIGYEKGPWSLRLSSAYISERLAEINFEDDRNDLYEDGHHQIDLTLKYDMNDRLQIHFHAMNLNEESGYRYYGNSRFNAQYDEIGRSFALGVTYRSF